MRELRKWAWAAVVAAAAATPAAAQQGTVTSTGGRTTGSLSGGAANAAGIGLGGGASLGNSGISSGGGGGGFGGGGGGGGTSSSAVNGGIQLQQMQTMAAPTAPTGTASSTLAASNRFAGYYANPYFQGISTNTNSAQNNQPGGFGQPLFGNATSGRGALASGGLTATGGGVGGRNALGGIGGQGSTQSGILIPLPSQIAYTAVMQFPTPPVAAGKIVTDVRAVIDATPMIANSKAVQIITDADNNVTLRGAVKDDDESRLIEGLVRLTPGVGAIKNELVPAAVSARR